MTQHPFSTRRVRAAYVSLATITIVAGLLVHLGGVGLSLAVRDVTGDALWAAMIFWWVSAVAPGIGRGLRGAAAYAVCACVELTQLLHWPALDALRETLPGRLVLGSGFDTRDFMAYAVGVITAMLLDLLVLRRVKLTVDSRR